MRRFDRFLIGIDNAFESGLGQITVYFLGLIIMGHVIKSNGVDTVDAAVCAVLWPVILFFWLVWKLVCALVSVAVFLATF
jgi:hypothetical protein